MPKAIVAITISPFSAPFTPPNPPSISLPVLETRALTVGFAPGKRIDLKQPTGMGTPYYLPGQICVSKPNGNPNLTLTLEVYDSARNEYPVCGVLFSPLPAFKDELAITAFSPTSFPAFTCHAGGGVDLESIFDANKRYSFVLLVQNALGGMAIIDPLISNQ